MRRARGQALVLGSLSLLILALMVALSFNLSHALHEKMRVQQHSDAMAYSMAIVEARSLNYFAVSNRAMAASYVAMNTLHAHMAAATVTTSMMTAGKWNFYIIMAEEFAQCACWTCFQHCFHGFKALKIANKFSRAANNYASKIRSVENSFERAIGLLDKMVDAIHLSQDIVFKDTAQALTNGTSFNLSRLQQKNAPRASSIPAAVGAFNLKEFTCAIDGLPCPGGPGNTSDDVHARLMTEVANATRPNWPANRKPLLAAMFPAHLNPSFLNELMFSIPGEGVTMPELHKATAKTTQGRSQSQLHAGQSSGNTGTVSGADEHGVLFSQWKDGFSFWKYSAEVYSDQNGGEHKPGSAHSGQHDFEGVNANALLSCIGRGNCFMKFRSNPDQKQDFGQPRVYSYVSQQLREGNVGKAPWELNRKASMTYGSSSGSATVRLGAGDGAGLSKAIIYYHKLGSWQDPPNLFSPYWRAKLHPFTSAQAVEVLTAAGNTDAAQLAAIPDLPL